MLIARRQGEQPVQTGFANDDWSVAFNFNNNSISCNGNGYVLPVPTNGYQCGAAGTGLRFGPADTTMTTGKLANITANTVTAVMIIEPRVATSCNNFLFAESAASTGSYNWGFYEDDSGFMRGFIHNGSVGIATPAVTNFSIILKPQVWVLTYDGANVALWYNGVLDGSNIQSGNIQRNSSAHLSFCRWNVTGVNSILYAAAVSNRFFSKSEVNSKFNNVNMAYKALFGVEMVTVPAYQPADSILVPPYLSNPGVSNITTTGAQPVVKVEY